MSIFSKRTQERLCPADRCLTAAPLRGILTGLHPELPQAAIGVGELPVLASNDLLLLRSWGRNTSQTAAESPAGVRAPQPPSRLPTHSGRKTQRQQLGPQSWVWRFHHQRITKQQLQTSPRRNLLLRKRPQLPGGWPEALGLSPEQVPRAWPCHSPQAQQRE